MGSGVFDFDAGKDRSDPGIRRLARAERRGGREASGRQGPGGRERDRVPDGPGGAADPAGSTSRARSASRDPHLALAFGRRRLQRLRRGVRAARRGGLRRRRDRRRRARAGPSRGPRAASRKRERVVVSHHSPFGLPADWEAKLAAMRQAGARAVKLVAGVADIAGSLKLAELQRRQADPSVAIFPMGPTSAPGRVLSALFGSRSRLRAGRARDGGRPDRDRGPARRSTRSTAAADRGALRRRRREHGALAVSVSPQRAFPRARSSIPLPAAPGLGLRAREA